MGLLEPVTDNTRALKKKKKKKPLVALLVNADSKEICISPNSTQAANRGTNAIHCSAHQMGGA